MFNFYSNRVLGDFRGVSGFRRKLRNSIGKGFYSPTFKHGGSPSPFATASDLASNKVYEGLIASSQKPPIPPKPTEYSKYKKVYEAQIKEFLESKKGVLPPPPMPRRSGKEFSVFENYQLYEMYYNGCLKGIKNEIENELDFGLEFIEPGDLRGFIPIKVPNFIVNETEKFAESTRKEASIIGEKLNNLRDKCTDYIKKEIDRDIDDKNYAKELKEELYLGHNAHNVKVSSGVVDGLATKFREHFPASDFPDHNVLSVRNVSSTRSVNREHRRG